MVDQQLDRVIGDCGLYESGHRRPGRLSLAEATTAAQQGEGFVWLGLQQPDPAEVAAVAAQFHLPALGVEDAVKARQRPKLEVHDGILFMILKPVRYVDHEEVVDVDQIESRVFDASHGADHSERIYKLKREIAEFRRAVVPLADPLERLAGGQVPGSNGQAAPYFRDVLDHLLRVAEAIEAHDRLLSDVLQANLARVATLQNQIAIRQNEDMRRISAWAAIALAPTAIAGIYGMNFDNMPELRWQYGYFLVLGAIVTVCTVLYVLFRRNDWL